MTPPARSPDYDEAMKIVKAALEAQQTWPSTRALEEDLRKALSHLAPLKAITHCEACGCSWLDNGLNPIGCPYCLTTKQAQQLAQAEQARDAHWADLCEVKAGDGLIARALYDEAMKRAAQAEQTVAQLTRARADWIDTHGPLGDDPPPKGK